MKTRLACGTAVLLLLLGGIAEARGREGRADAQFGANGGVMLATQVEGEAGATPLPDGRSLVAGYRSVLVLSPTGEVDSGFGQDGRISPLLPPGASEATIHSVLVDSQGRILVIGGCAFPATGANVGEGYHSEILAERFGADGQLDRSFGGGVGYAATDFDLPAQSPAEGTQVWTTSATLDAGDRVLLSGSRASEKYFYKGFQLQRSEAFVARLTPEGLVDRGFANAGVLPLAGRELSTGPVADRLGGIYLAADGTLFHLLASGQPDPAFGENGGRPMPEGTESEPVVDPDGRLLVFGYLQGWKKHRLANGVLIKRLLPNGESDRGFGRNGAVAFRLSRLYTARIGVDQRGKVLVAAALERRRQLGRRPAQPAALALARLGPDGRFDRGFDQGGIVRVPFPRAGELNLGGLELLGDEALLGATWCGHGCGTALARIHVGP
jgi:uncharacterized delta-60 repeat protein